MSFVTHAPDRAPSAAIATGAPPDAGRWTGQVHRPRRRGTTLIGTPGYTVPAPHSGDPYRPRTRRSRSARVPGSVGAAKAADGRHPWSRPLVPSRFRNRIVHWRRCEFSTPASRHRASMPPITREACRKGTLNLSGNLSLCAAGGAGQGRRQGSPSPRHPRRSILENGGGAPQSVPYRARRREHAHTLGTSGFNVQPHPIGRDCRHYYA